MKNIFIIILLTFLISSCQDTEKVNKLNKINWKNRTTSYRDDDSIIHGSSYLSIYSEIYSQSEHKTHDLTATVSIRNINRQDTILIDRAEYFNTEGKSIRVYFDKTIYVSPLETVEIVIDETDKEGGTGANFLFDWTIKHNTQEPFFEGIMISTSGQQGLSFTTQGKRTH